MDLLKSIFKGNQNLYYKKYLLWGGGLWGTKGEGLSRNMYKGHMDKAKGSRCVGSKVRDKDGWGGGE